jgi:flavin reductase (DIM6/NTAB) family NADH-FMN oxidoreductase RutF
VSNVNKIDQPREVWDRLFATPGHLAMITSVDTEGRVNACTVATCVRVVHDPLQIAFTISTHRDTARNVQNTRQFVVNLPSFEQALLEKVLVVGVPFAPGVNELEKAGLTATPSRMVSPPRITECKRHFECEVEWTREWTGRLMVVGNAVAASVDEGCLDERGFILWDELKPVHYCGAPYNNVTPGHSMFVGCYETMSVPLLYDGPETEDSRRTWEKL